MLLAILIGPINFIFTKHLMLLLYRNIMRCLYSMCSSTVFVGTFALMFGDNVVQGNTERVLKIPGCHIYTKKV